MAADKACSDCNEFWAIERETKKGAISQLSRGYCLARCVFPKTWAKKKVLPLKARVDDMPDDRAVIKLVHRDEVVLGCVHRKDK